MSPIEPARPGDLASLIQLVGSADGCSPATVWSLPWDLGHYWLIRSGTQVIAAGSLQSVGDGVRAEIRGLAVAPAAQGRGLATRMVRHLCELAGRAGLSVVCVTRKPRFFERQGFAVTEADWLPPSRRDVGHSAGPPRVALCLQEVS